MAKDSKLWEEAVAASRRYQKIKVPSHPRVKPKPKKSPYTIQTIDSKDIKDRLKEINTQMKALKIERRELLKRLKPWVIDYEKIPYKIYVLKLEGGYYYIGISRRPEKRFRAHLKGKGATWTKAHKPLEIVEVRETFLTLESEAVIKENEVTIEYAKQYGHGRVRGGGYCQAKPRWPTEVLYPELIYKSSD